MNHPTGEVPEADAVAQHTGVVPEEPDPLIEVHPLEADPADVLDQHRPVPLDEEDL
ncbi:hypothetical protein [Crossiella sp. CA198]|uniref:hypothetical protein n=1 Tax=Crossiella sp. CA198 TaxID=3455607 RepID=UPI003F8D52E1